MKLFCTLTSCCCGCTLRTGSLIIGILELIFSAFILIGSIVLCAGIKYILEVGYIIDENSQKIYLTEEAVRILNAYYIIYIVFAVLCSFWICIDIVMLVGVSKNKPNLLKPWVILSMISYILSVISSIAFAIYGFQSENATNGVLGIIYSLLVFSLRWYFVSVVHSHYEEITK